MYSYVHMYCKYIYYTYLTLRAQYHTYACTLHECRGDRKSIQTYVQMHIHVCRLWDISLHGHTHTVLHVWFSHVTHISHWRTEVHSTIRILVLVHTQHFRCVELVEDADQRTTVPVVSHTASIVTLTCQILQSCK